MTLTAVRTSPELRVLLGVLVCSGHASFASYREAFLTHNGPFGVRADALRRPFVAPADLRSLQHVLVPDLSRDAVSSFALRLESTHTRSRKIMFLG